MSRITIRFDAELYEQLQEMATKEEVAVAAIVRQAVSQFVTGQQPDSGQSSAEEQPSADKVSREVQQILQQQVDDLRTQLQIKDDQISELHQLIAMKEKTTQDVAQQLQDTRLQLEDIQRLKQMPWWKKLFAVKHAG